MKKILFWIAVSCLVAGFGAAVTYRAMYNEVDSEQQDSVLTENNQAVELLIEKDRAYFDNMAGKVTFYESRIVMPKAFNESDVFVAQEVTNVFQHTVGTENGGFTTEVYFFTHQLNDCATDIDIHKEAFMVEDRAIDMDSISITFDKAFRLARQSNYAPSTSRYITLRNPLGSKPCNPQYSIGNQTYGQLWVDAITGDVTDKAPNIH